MKKVRFIETFTPTYDFIKLTNPIDIAIDELLKQLSIRKGTYPFNVEIGSEIYQYIFGFSDAETYQAVYNEIEYIINNIPDLILDEIKLSFTSDRKGVIIDVYVKVVSTGQREKISLLATEEYIILVGDDNV